MVPPEVDQLVTFLRDRVGENLRSVVYYDGEEYDVAYLQEDVREQYSADEMEEVVEDLGFEALTKPMQEELYVHGSLNCTVKCFEDAIEMNFPFSEREGVAVSLSGEAFVTQQTFIGKCMETVGVR
jgi:hypothetical protein